MDGLGQEFACATLPPKAVSQSAIKQTRREIRRAMGENGIAALAEVQANIPVLTASLDTAHQRLDVMADQQKLVDASVQHCVQGLYDLRVALDAHYDAVSDTECLGRFASLETFYASQRTFGSRLRWLLTGR